MVNAPHFEDAWRFARDTWDDHGIEELQRLGCRRDPLRACAFICVHKVVICIHGKL